MVPTLDSHFLQIICNYQTNTVILDWLNVKLLLLIFNVSNQIEYRTPFFFDKFIVTTRGFNVIQLTKKKLIGFNAPCLFKVSLVDPLSQPLPKKKSFTLFIFWEKHILHPVTLMNYDFNPLSSKTVILFN